MTPFKKWCARKGYDPKGEFYTKNNIDQHWLEKGDKLKLFFDDGSDAPLFSVVNRFDMVCIRLKNISQQVEGEK